ncbi:MAG TPA: sigma-70 family RNA polymerase sigma factor [Polyangia bacterium]
MSGSCMDANQSAAPALPDAEADLRVAAMVANHHSQVWRSLRRLGLSECDADDASQQVFLVAHRRLADIAPETEQSFLLQTALRVASEFRRSLRRRREDNREDLPVVVDTAASPEELADRQRARAVLDRALGAMPMDLRQVFVLFDLEELTTVEVSNVLHIPKGTVASRLRRAREVFRKTVLRLTAPRSSQYGAGGKL